MIQLRDIRLHECTIPLRTPFRFGMVELSSLRHMVVSAAFEGVGGPSTAMTWGHAGENLVPKWFTKDPKSTLQQDIQGLRDAVRAVASLARTLPPVETVFAFWMALDAAAAGGVAALAPLVRQLGVSLFERAAIDAACRVADQPFWKMLSDGSLGFRPEAVHPVLAGENWRGALPDVPVNSLLVRHTVGLADSVDELPQKIAHGNVRRLKIKLSGDPTADEARISAIIACSGSALDRITLDGNENYASIQSLRALLQGLRSSDALGPPRGKLAWIEQPLHRDLALTDAVAPLLEEFVELPMVIDESDAASTDLPRALQLGYAGTTHKNCKGVFKSVLAATLLARHRRETGQETILSGEDLTIVAPWSQAQDLAVAATVGVVDIERNGQHYADGLSAFDRDTNRRACADHPDLYELDHRAVAAMRVERGAISVRTVNAAPFGTQNMPQMDGFELVRV